VWALQSSEQWEVPGNLPHISSSEQWEVPGNLPHIPSSRRDNSSKGQDKLIFCFTDLEGSIFKLIAWAGSVYVLSIASDSTKTGVLVFAQK